MRSIFGIKLTKAEKKAVRREFWGAFIGSSILIAVFDKLGYTSSPRSYKWIINRPSHSWDELLSNVPYILVISFVIGILFLVGELTAIKEKRAKKRNTAA